VYLKEMGPLPPSQMGAGGFLVAASQQCIDCHRVTLHSHWQRNSLLQGCSKSWGMLGQCRTLEEHLFICDCPLHLISSACSHASCSACRTAAKIGGDHHNLQQTGSLTTVEGCLLQSASIRSSGIQLGRSPTRP